MNEELLQRDLLKNPEKIGKWDFYNIGATTIKALKEAGIILGVDYGDIDSKKVDAMIVSRKKVIAIIEYKKPAEFKTKAQQEKAINQEIEVAKILKAKIIIATDTQETVWVNVQTGNRIKDENGQELTYKFDKADEKLPALIEKISFSIHEKNDQIKPAALVNPTDLARSIWQDIWIASHESPTICLYTFVELFIFKYLSDLKILRGRQSFSSIIAAYSDTSTKNILSDYVKTVRPHIKKLFPEGEDGTTIFNGSVFVADNDELEPVESLAETFKKVLLKFENYGTLEHIHPDFKSQLFETFLKQGDESAKKGLGQFFTPLSVVRAVAEMAKDEIKEGITICDPACGVGKFLLEPIKKHIENFYQVTKTGITSKIKLVGYDKGLSKNEQKTVVLAKANMLIYLSDLVKENSNLTKEFAKLFNESFELKTTSILGTLAMPVHNEYDLILTNPPYVTSGSSTLKDEINKDGELKDYYKVNGVGVEGLFMEWIIRALKPNGKAFVILPDGVFSRQSDKNMRQFMLDECYIDGIISLPTKTFFTTAQDTYIICLTKKANKTAIQNFPVFTYLVSEIGESRDVYRFPIEQDDLKSAVELFSFYKGNKQGFAKFNVDKRCKMLAIEDLQKVIEKSWIIENFWTDEEKINLGISNAINLVPIAEVPVLLDDFISKIVNLKQELSILLHDIEKLDIVYQDFVMNEIFDFPSIKGLTANFIQQNKGEIPVYGGRMEETPVGYVADDMPNVKYFENCLTWNREGSVGYVFWHKHKFTTNDHHRPLLVKPEYAELIDLAYMQFTIQKMLLSKGFAWSKTASKEKVKDFLIKIPILNNGKIDINSQKQIAEKHQKIEEIKKFLTLEVKKITDSTIDI
jgi:type I restriction enzyme M protein